MAIYTLSDAEFAAKVDYEGGLEEAIIGYGLSANDLTDESGELYRAMVEYDKWVATGTAIRNRVLNALPEEWDEY
jgi:hypothetical protein